MNKRLRILGTRGVPAAHGGFETFAEQLSLFLVARGWDVTVYCQEDGQGALTEDRWQGVHRVRIPVAVDGPKGTLVFDWHATRHAARRPGLCLTLGYNTAVLCLWLRVRGVPNIINMDGIEWRRAKWGPMARLWLWGNEHAGVLLGNQLVADHPEIAAHLQRNRRLDKVHMIPYGADRIDGLDDAVPRHYGLDSGRFLTLIARPEPENSVLEVVQAFSRRARGMTLVVLGTYKPDHPYHVAVRAAAGPEVRFLGAVYDTRLVQGLRCHSAAYVHGHQVGGTNPSLVEALGAGNAVVAHDNRFNRWVAADAARYFSDADSAAAIFDTLLDDPAALAGLQSEARRRHAEAFTWASVLQQYEHLLERFLPATA